MRGAGYARFMELRGRRILEGAGSVWYSVSGRLLMPVAYHTPIAPDPAQVKAMLARSSHLGARFPSKTCGGLSKGLWVCRRKQYDISVIHQNSRRSVRRGLNDCEIRPVETRELLDQGLALNLDTMDRQGRYEAEFGDPKSWRRLVEAIPHCSTISALGAFVGGRMAAYAILSREDGWLHILHQFSHRDLLQHRPNDGLAFTVTRMGADDPAIEGVCYGLTGLVDTQGLNRFKIYHGYEIEELSDSFLLHPLAETVLANSAASWALKTARRIRPSDQTLERVQSVLEGARLTRLGLREATA